MLENLVCGSVADILELQTMFLQEIERCLHDSSALAPPVGKLFQKMVRAGIRRLHGGERGRKENAPVLRNRHRIGDDDDDGDDEKSCSSCGVCANSPCRLLS